MKRLLFIGGTNFFGKQTVIKLIETKKYDIALLTRGNNIPIELKDSIKFIKCNRHEVETLKSLLKNKYFDILIDNIAYTAVDVKNILNIFRGKIEHYLLCSSGAVYPQSSLHEWEESEAILKPIKGHHSYANNKREAESELLNYHDVPYSIYRPTVVEGPEDSTKRTRYFVEKIYQQKHFYIPEGVIFKHVYSGDVANAIERLVAIGPTNAAYNICGDDKISIQTYCDMIAQLLGKPSCYTVVSIDRFMLLHHKNFPNSYERSLLLSNELIKMRVDYQPTFIDQWLPITVQWNLNHIIDSLA